ncbi:hypothetical protein ACBJ59_61375 [Nonomuraea sp. MTCD27]|uniref:hypothetical protein n=1 Tax=Nonomuraea sp. MTCD27 TaxID=1676747 RepID=UPI0035C16D57
MARLFDGVDDKITLAAGGLSTSTLAGTRVLLFRRTTATEDGLLGVANASNANSGVLLCFTDNTLAFFGTGTGSSASSLTITSSDGWILLAVSKASGSQSVTFRKYVYATDTWTSDTPAALVSDGTALGAGSVKLGSYYDGTGPFFNGEMAAVAIYNRVLTQAELDTLAHSLTAWQDAGPAALWVLDQADAAQPVYDWSGGGANQTAIVGTSTDTSSSPIGYGERYIETTPIRAVHATVEPPTVQGVAAIPAPDVSVGVNVQPEPVTGTAIIPAPDIFVGDSPPTLVQPSPITTAATIPTPDIALGIGLHPVPLIGRALIPTPTVDVPINPGDDLTGPGQISSNGFKLGAGTPYLWQRITGWYADMPGVDNGNVPHPTAHGALSGQKLSQPRIVTFDMKVEAAREDLDQIALNLLAGLPLPEADEEVPLAIRVGDLILVGTGACTHRQMPIETRAVQDGYLPGTVIWELSNPRLYSRELLTAVVADGATVEVFHAGNNTTHPTIRCPGPSLNPELVIERTLDDGTESVVTVGFDLTVEAGETLIVDSFNGTASIGDEDVGGTLSNASLGIADLVFGRQFSAITFSSALGTAPAATVLWRHAYI